LAKDVYLGVVPLTASADGKLQLGGTGECIDSLVLMRRLPADLMLDNMIARDLATEKSVFELTSHLAAFYNGLPPALITGPQYRKQLAGDLKKAAEELAAAGSEIPAPLAQQLVESELVFLRENQGLIDARVRAGKIVEGHGDLRPEHVCLQSPPAIIDCLEFNRTLRTLDIASELTFLALECERIGAPQIGDMILKKYGEETGDQPSPMLLAFYKIYHACVRAKIAVWHLKDVGIRDQSTWTARARQYLNMVAPMNRAA
jgi:aminoglycoside phosphotransferase family enzyme